MTTTTNTSMNAAMVEYNDLGTFEICKVTNYKINYNNSIKVVKEINEISQLLKNDCCYHEYLHADDILKLSVDVDKLTLHNPKKTIQNVLNDISVFLTISINDISYTTNYSVEFGSHHVVIPNFYLESSKQKGFMEEF